MATEKDVLLLRKDTPDDDHHHTTINPISPITTLKDFYDYVGVGRTQRLAWVVSFFTGYADYSELLLISIIIPTLRCHWDLSEDFEVGLSFALFGSYAAISWIVARTADKLGRKWVMVGNSVVLLVASLTAAIIDNKWVFLGTRLFTGAAVGANASVLIPYTVEVSPDGTRSRGPVLFNIGVVVALLSVNLQGLLFLDWLGYRGFIIILTLPLIAMTTVLLFMPESPRYLLVSRKRAELEGTLIWIAKTNGIILAPQHLDIRATELDLTITEKRGSLKEMFSPKIRRNVLALALFFFANIFMEFGLIVLLPLLFTSGFCGTSSRIGPEYKCATLSTADFTKLMMTSGAALLGIAGFLITVLRFGRLLPLRLGALLTALITVGFYFCVNEEFTLVVALGAKLLEAGANCILWITMSEMFPTTVRATVVGFINSVGKLGGVFGTCSVYFLFYKSTYGLITLFLVVQILGFIGTMIVNREGRDLELSDSTSEIR